MSTFNEFVLVLGGISIAYGMLQAVRGMHLAAGYALLLGGACIGEWSANHILTSPIHISWPGLLLLVTVPLTYMLIGIMHLVDAFWGED